MNIFEEYDKLSFEDAMKELESIVQKLDAGEGTLDESISLFQKGMYLSKLCSTQLEEIENRVRILTEGRDGMKQEVDFPLGEDSDK